MTPTFTLHGHFISSPNQTSPPVPFTKPQPLSKPYTPTSLKSHLWALDGYPYLAFCDRSPFQGELFALLVGSVDEMLLDHDRHGWHLPRGVAKSWKQFEHTLRLIAKRLKEWSQAASSNIRFLAIEPQLPSQFGYFTAHSTENEARSGLRSSLDAFTVYFAYVSFLAALCQFTGKASGAPAWLVCLAPPDDIPPEFLDIFKTLGIVDFYGRRKHITDTTVHPEFLNMFKRSHIVNFSGERTRSGTIIDVLRCDWIEVADILFKAKVPMWLYWGNHPLTVTPRASWMIDYRPELVNLNLPPVEGTLSPIPPVPLPPLPQSPPILSALEVIALRRSAKDQLPGETYKKYFIRRQKRNEARMMKETAQDKQVRLSRERAAATRPYPGRKGPAVYYWEPDSDGFRVRTHQTRAEAQKLWGAYSNAQKIFDSFTNEWDCCTLFGDDDSDTDDDDDIYYPLAPSNAVMENATRSTSLRPHKGTTPSLPPPHEEPMPSLPPPHEEPTPSLPLSHEEPMPSLPPPHEEPTPSLPPPHDDPVPSLSPPHEDPTPSLPLSHEEPAPSNPSLVTSLEDVISQGIPMNIDAQSLPSPPRNSVNLASTPRRRDESPMHCCDRPPRRDLDRLNRYKPRRRSRDTYRDSRSASPRRTHYSEDRYPRDGGSRSTYRRFRSRSRGSDSYKRNSSAMVDSDPDADLLTLSRAIVLSVHPPDSTIRFPFQTDSLEDYVYYRFGFHLSEKTYTGIPSSAFSVKFGDWLEVRRSIGCHQLDGLPAYRQPIQDFLECLLSTDDPLRHVPAKFWDLNASNNTSLNLAAGFVHIEPKKFLDGTTHYLIRPVGLHASRDSSWVLAVDAMTALECVRRRLGPHTIDIADFLMNRGIPFRTLRPMTSTPAPHTPPRPISNLLGNRPMNYRFDVADFSAYQTLCDSVLKDKPFCRAALCMGGIVARLAREVIPNTAALIGPSQEALDGHQKIMVCDDGIFCDDDVSETYTDLICGVYKVFTVHRNLSWFPKPNVWAQAGYNVGQWTRECENWFESRMTEIHNGGQPLDSRTWRTKLLLSRKATKLTRKMNSAAASFLNLS